MAPGPRRRFLRSFALFVGVGILLQGAFWAATRAPAPDVQLPLLGPARHEGARSSLAGSSLERRDGYWFFAHRGDAVTLGAAHGVLGQFMTQRVEESMFNDFARRVPGVVGLALPPVLLWTFRKMPGSVPLPLREELWGFSAQYADRHAFPLGSYQRGFYYHALHDITQQLVGNPWVDPAIAGACTGFGASGPGTVDGHAIVGRNFDFEVLPLFDAEKVVHLFARDGAIPVLSISWMAMAGVVTGMNAEGIWVSINAARTERTGKVAAPVTLQLRWILEQAHHLDDVRRSLRDEPALVADLFLAGDGETGEVVVFERGVGAFGERGTEGGKVSVANHFLAAPNRGDPGDAELRRWSTTEARGARMAELMAEAPVSVDRGIEILRDRRGAAGRPLAPGNRNAIDALITTHGVVADLTDRVIWVSTAPHTLGSWRAIDLFAEMEHAGIDVQPYRATLAPGARAWEGDPSLPGPGDRAEDPFLHDGYPQVRRWQEILLDADKFLDHGDAIPSLDMADRAVALVPESHEGWFRRGHALAALGRTEEARAAYEKGMVLDPDRGPVLGRVERWLDEHRAK
jgi:hypothetical protein